MPEIQPTNPVKPATAAVPAASSAPAYPTVEDVKRVVPDASVSDIQNNLPYIVKAMGEYGLTSKNQLVGIIATVVVETGSFKPITEAAPRPTVSGGPRYRGRGYIQITHDYLYKKYGQLLNLPLFEQPEIANQPEVAAKIMMMYWLGKHNKAQRCVEVCEQQNWHEVRRRVNGSSTGYKNDYGRKFKPAIDRGLAVFKSGISGVPTMPGNYGADDFDTNGAPHTVLTGQHNPQSQLAAIEYALGLMALDTHKALQSRFLLDVASQPDILKLDAQSTFALKGMGEGLDDTYTVEEVLFTFGDRLEAEVIAYKPDPNAPAPQIFVGNADMPNAPVQHAGIQPAGAAAGGDISAKLWAAAQAARNRSTAMGPGGGRVACAWAVNLYAVEPAGFKRLGGSGYMSVAACKADLDGGRGQKVPRAQAVAGDIWIDPSGRGHIGFCSSAGCRTVFSNSSSKAKFGAWDASIESVNAFYAKGQEHIYRLLK